jgi:hypothetical protein
MHLGAASSITDGGIALNWLGGLPAYQTISNSEYRQVQLGSETMVAKDHGQKGKSPDHQLRSQNND